MAANCCVSSIFEVMMVTTRKQETRIRRWHHNECLNRGFPIKNVGNDSSGNVGNDSGSVGNDNGNVGNDDVQGCRQERAVRRWHRNECLNHGFPIENVGNDSSGNVGNDSGSIGNDSGSVGNDSSGNVGNGGVQGCRQERAVRRWHRNECLNRGFPIKNVGNDSGSVGGDGGY